MAPHEDENRSLAPPSWTIDDDDFYRKATRFWIESLTRGGMSAADAEDVVEAAFVAYVRCRRRNGPFASEKDRRRWLRKAVLHSAIDLFRRNANRKARSLDDLPTEPIDKVADPYLVIEGQEWLAWLSEQLDREDPLNVRLFCEHCIEGRSLEELAKPTRLTPQAIHARIYRLRKKIIWEASGKLTACQAVP